MLGLTFESLQSRQKLQQGNDINKNSAFMLIDPRQCNSSCCEWEARSPLANMNFRSDSSEVNPRRTGQEKATEILWFFFPSPTFQVLHRWHATIQLHFDLYAARFSLCWIWDIYNVAVLSKGLDKVTVTARDAQGILPISGVETPMPLTPMVLIPQFTSRRVPRSHPQSCWRASGHFLASNSSLALLR